MGGCVLGTLCLVYRACFHLWEPFCVHPHGILQTLTLYAVQMENKITKSPSKLAKSVKEVSRKKTLPSEE